MELHESWQEKTRKLIFSFLDIYIHTHRYITFTYRYEINYCIYTIFYNLIAYLAICLFASIDYLLEVIYMRIDTIGL